MNIPDDKFAAAVDAIYNALKELNDGEEMAFILSIRDVEPGGLDQVPTGDSRPHVG